MLVVPGEPTGPSLAAGPFLAPQWAAYSPPLVLTSGFVATWTIEWAPVPGARDYLLEVGADPSFAALRHPAIATSTARFEGALPPGRHHVRVRARGEDGSIGPPSESRVVHVLAMSTEPPGLAFEGSTLVLEPGSELRFVGAQGVEVARGRGSFAPLRDRVSIDAGASGKWRLRIAGEEPLTLDVRVTGPCAVVRAGRRDEGLRIVAIVQEQGEASQACRPLRARARGARSSGQVDLVDDAIGTRSAILRWPLIGEGQTTIEVVDANGSVLATTTIEDVVFEPEPPRRVLGTVLPPLALSPRTDAPWSAPTAPFAVALSGGVGFGQSSARGVGRVLLQGSWEFLSFDASWRTREAEQVRQEELTWLGVRWRLYEADQQAFAMGIITRTGLPLIEGGRLRLENGFALGGADDTWSWLVNTGARTRVGGYDEMSNDTWSVHLAGGGSFRPTDRLRIFAASTMQMVAFGDAGKLGDIGGGAFLTEWTTGAEIGVGPLLFGPHVIAATAPKDDFEPAVALQLWVGYAPPLE